MISEAVGLLREDGGIDLNENYRKWYGWDVFRDEVCRRCVFLPSCLGNCPKEHLTLDPDHCPAFKYNWEEVLANVALRRREGVIFKPPYTRIKVNLVNQRLKGMTTKEVLALGAQILFERIKNLKLERRRIEVTTEQGGKSDDPTFTLRGENHLVVVLNSTGYQVWNMLDGKRSIEEIVAELAAKFALSGNDTNGLRLAIVDFVIDLVNGGLLSPDSVEDLRFLRVTEGSSRFDQQAQTKETLLEASLK